jgi:transcription elongation factor Elf1
MKKFFSKEFTISFAIPFCPYCNSKNLSFLKSTKTKYLKECRDCNKIYISDKESFQILK